ncbi:hypothetical protein B0H14DRAFT_3431573 [Mycena olivaceomarginata]|nr:hypothetical protein B0H14DRAFT_3431573 [Mycena olivaceomarginata]
MEHGYTPGRVPRQILEQLYALDEEYETKVAALAASCNKDPATLRRATTPHELRSTSAWNMYSSHHAVHHPKPPGVSAAQYNTDARRAFEALLPGLSKAEMGKTSLVLERLPWLHNWWKELNANHIENLRTKGQYKVRAKKAVEPLIQMAKQLSNTWGMHIFAVAIDPPRRRLRVQASPGFMGDLETKIRVIQMEERGEDASRLYIPRPSRTSNQTVKKGKHDVYHNRFGTIMGDHLAKMCFQKGLFTVEQVKTSTMVWNDKFLDLAFRGKFRIIDYPLALENIGQVIGTEQFNTKAPNVKEYDSFMPALERAVKNRTDEDPDRKPVIRIVPWEPAERDQQLEDQEDIPLVVSTDGRALKMVRHSPVYGAAVAEAASQRAQRRADKKRAEGTPPPHQSRPPPPIDAGSPILAPARRTRLPPHAPPSQHAQPKRHAALERPRSHLPPPAPPSPPAQPNAIAGPSSLRPRHNSTARRESALARRLQLSPAADTPIERPAKRRRRDDDNHDAQRVGQTQVGNRKRKHSPDSPGGGDASREPPLIAMRLGVGNQRSEIFYAMRFQPASRARRRDRYTFYYGHC